MVEEAEYTGVSIFDRAETGNGDSVWMGHRFAQLCRVLTLVGRYLAHLLSRARHVTLDRLAMLSSFDAVWTCIAHGGETIVIVCGRSTGNVRPGNRSPSPPDHAPPPSHRLPPSTSSAGNPAWFEASDC